MGSLKSGLFAIALTSLVGTAAVVGCSADGASGITDTTDPTDPGAVDDGTGRLPPSSSSGNPTPVDAGKDASKKDSGGPKPEAGVDAGPPPPVVGSPCPTIDAQFKKSCGKCGTSAALCVDDGTGKGKWSDYSACEAETGVCTPGETVTEDCGNCGKQVKTCGQFCVFSTSACNGQPANSCKPGSTEYSSAGCATASTYRNRACGAACTWGSFSATCAAPVNEIVLDIGGAVGATTSKTITFSAARQGPRLGGTCPNGTLTASTKYPYQYVEIHNPSATKAATVTLYASTAPGGQIVDTVMGVYGTPVQPMDDVGRKACRDGTNDQSSSADIALTGDTNFSLIKAVAVPAGGSVLVWIGAWVEVGALDLDGLPGTGDLNINTKIETLN